MTPEEEAELKKVLEPHLTPTSIKNRTGRQLEIVAQTRASKNEIVIETVDAKTSRVKLKIKSPPVEGRANEEIIAFFSDIFHLPKNKIHILSGEKSKRKRIFFEGF